MIRPRGPEPATVVRSTECASAARRATGEAAAPSGAAGRSSAASRATGAIAAMASRGRLRRPRYDQHWADGHGVAFAHENSLIVPPAGAGSSTYLVGRDLDERMAGLDAIADLHRPGEDRAFADRLAGVRGDDVDDRRRRRLRLARLRSARRLRRRRTVRRCDLGEQCSDRHAVALGDMDLSSVPAAGAAPRRRPCRSEISTIVSSACDASPSALRHSRTAFAQPSHPSAA